MCTDLQCPRLRFAPPRLRLGLRLRLRLGLRGIELIRSLPIASPAGLVATAEQGGRSGRVGGVGGPGRAAATVLGVPPASGGTENNKGGRRGGRMRMGMGMVGQG